jgi:flagella basal body P-ring formation protein FlgA
MRIPALCLIVLAAAPLGANQATPDAGVGAAIVAAVRARMGEGADVRVEGLRIPAGTPRPVVQARPDPGARIGRAVRFNLATTAGRAGTSLAWSGSASAAVHVAVEHLHARHPISRGTTITGSDVEIVRHELEGGPLRPWPGADAIGRSRAIRDLPEGVCISRTSLAVVPLVQAGQDVQAIARIGGVEAAAQLVAAESGDVGSVIRVVNPESRRTLKARVVSAGVVEVLND